MSPTSNLATLPYPPSRAGTRRLFVSIGGESKLVEAEYCDPAGDPMGIQHLALAKRLVAANPGLSLVTALSATAAPRPKDR